MTWVKVCGLTNKSDVAAAVAAGADAVGFVNVPASPRFVNVEDAADLALHIAAETILLTLDRTAAEVLEILRSTTFSGVQLYGEHRLDAARAVVKAGYLALYPVPPKSGTDYEEIPGLPLLDTPSRQRLGGTGEVFDWSLASGISRDFVLAGGLGPHNVAEAIAQARPWGVDASSQLERAPGHKDHGMVADFIKKAKET